MIMLSALILMISLIGILWPFIIYPLILKTFSPWPQKIGPVDLSATLLFCAYNEAEAMPAKMANIAMLQRRFPTLEALVFDDGSNDGTSALIEASEANIKCVRGNDRAGKAHGMKHLVSQAKGDILIFTDANVLLADDAIDNLLGYYFDADVGGVLGTLHYKGAEKSSAASIGGLYWRWEEALKDMESATGNVLGADGSIFSIRRQLYPDFPDDVLDDLTVSMAVVFARKRLIKARDVVAHEVLVSNRGDEYRRKVRIAARAWRTHRYLLPQLKSMRNADKFKYASRKIVRWFGCVFLITGAISALSLGWMVSVPTAVAFVIAGAAVFTIGLMQKRGPVAAVFDILLAYVATLHGILRAMVGEAPTIWTPAKSR